MRADPKVFAELTERTRFLDDFQMDVFHLLEQITPEQCRAESVQAYTGLLRQMARECRVAGEQVQDLVQEVWVDFLRAVPRLVAGREQTDLRGWSFRVMQRRACEARRHQGDNLEGVMAASQEPLAPQQEPGDDLEQREEWQRVRAAVDQLRQEGDGANGRIVVLHFWESRTAEEIAAVLRLSRTTIFNRLRQARARLKEILAR